MVEVVLNGGVGTLGVTPNVLERRNESYVEVVTELDREDLEQLLETRKVVVEGSPGNKGRGADLFDPHGETFLVADQSERGVENRLARTLALATELRYRLHL